MQVTDLEVYRRLYKLALEIHRLTLNFPKFELFELGSQLRRSSNSTAANLAEGFGSKHTAVFTEGISRSQGELRETLHHLRMTCSKGYIEKKLLDRLVFEYTVCSKMLYRLEKSLDSNNLKS